MSIYTRTGDGGETGTLGPDRIAKDDIRMVACGDLDELNSVIGCALAGAVAPEVAIVLKRVQKELFVLGVALAKTGPRSQQTGNLPELTVEHIGRLEVDIDRLSVPLSEIKAFILPGGDQMAAHLHMARAVCRRAERSVVALARKSQLTPACIGYLNRLSDLLFTMARYQNRHTGRAETVWE